MNTIYKKLKNLFNDPNVTKYKKGLIKKYAGDVNDVVYLGSLSLEKLGAVIEAVENNCVDKGIYPDMIKATETIVDTCIQNNVEYSLAAKCFKLYPLISKHEPEKTLKSLVKVSPAINEMKDEFLAESFKLFSEAVSKSLFYNPKQYTPELKEKLLKNIDVYDNAFIPTKGKCDADIESITCSTNRLNKALKRAEGIQSNNKNQQGYNI